MTEAKQEHGQALYAIWCNRGPSQVQLWHCAVWCCFSWRRMVRSCMLWALSPFLLPRVLFKVCCVVTAVCPHRSRHQPSPPHQLGAVRAVLLVYVIIHGCCPLRLLPASSIQHHPSCAKHKRAFPVGEVWNVCGLCPKMWMGCRFVSFCSHYVL